MNLIKILIQGGIETFTWFNVRWGWWGSPHLNSLTGSNWLLGRPPAPCDVAIGTKKTPVNFYIIIQLCLPVCRITSVRNSYTSFVIPVPSNHSLHKNLPLKFGCQYNRKMLLKSKEVCLRELRHITVSCPCWPNGDSLLNGPFSNKYNTIISLMYLGQQRSGAAYLLAGRQRTKSAVNPFLAID